MRRKRKRAPKGPVYKKLDVEAIRALGVHKKPSLDYGWRRGASTMQIPSLDPTSVANSASTTSVMDPRALAAEPKEIRDEIIAKSKRVAISYSKGAYQYISDETDIKEIGRKNPT